MEADSGVTSDERKDDVTDAVDGGSADAEEAGRLADMPPSPDTDDSVTPTDEMGRPVVMANQQAVVQQAEVMEDAVAMEEETTALAYMTEVATAETTEQGETPGDEDQAGAGETTEQENEGNEEEAAQEEAAAESGAGGGEEAAKENAPGEATERAASSTGKEGGEEDAQKNAAGEATARAGSATGEGEATDQGETTAEEQEVSQTPLIVRVDRRRLTTTPADNSLPPGSQAPIPGPRLPALRGQAQGQGHIRQLPSPPDSDVRGRKGNERLPTRPRLPPKLVRLATVTVSPSSSRPKMAPRGPSLYYEAPSKPTKVITWDAAMAARPPLPVDLEGPTPWSYSPRNKPLYETNAPAYSFGRRCQPEKSGGSRTAWSKSWFQTPHVWLNKTNFVSDDIWPSPAHYRKRGLLGPRQTTVHEAPAFSIGERKIISMTKKGVEKEPAPPDYDRQTADAAVFRRGASFSHQFRRQGTVLWGSMENTPGPAAYTPLTKWRKPAPAGFTIQGTRRQKSTVLGPFATL